jgi:uncharacterized membrane protein YhaH (DUF805 family)
MNFLQALSSAFSKYATFSGRARRAEYWYFTLFICVVSVVLQILAGGDPPSLIVVSVLGLFAIATLLPALAVTARRLHDTDRKGWWMLLSCIPVVGLIVLFWMCSRGTAGSNRFGDDPLA